MGCFDLEEEVALLLVLEAVLATQAEFLGYASDAEGLAGEAAAEDVVGEDVGDGDLVDVPDGGLAEVGRIGALGGLAPIAGEDAFTAGTLKSEAEAADAAEQVYESEPGGSVWPAGR